MCGLIPYQLFTVVVAFDYPIIGDAHRNDKDVRDGVGGQSVHYHRQQPCPSTGGLPTPGARAFQEDLQELLLPEQFNYVLRQERIRCELGPRNSAELRTAES